MKTLRLLFHFGMLASIVGLSLFIASCQDHRLPLPGQSIQSTSPKLGWGPTITPQMLAVIEELGRLAPVPIENLTPTQARQQPSFKDAVNSLLDKNKVAPPTFDVFISERMIPSFNGVSIRAKIYTPNNVTGPMPVIVYYHGGLLPTRKCTNTLRWYSLRK